MNITLKELDIRLQKIRQAMKAEGLQNILLRSVPNHIYLTGSVFQGFTFIDLSQSLPLFFVERATSIFEGYPEDLVYEIRKPELIPDLLRERGLELNEQSAYELGHLPMTEYERLRKLAVRGEVSQVDATALMREVRSIKTDEEVREIRRLALIHMEIYRLVPELYRSGMTDSELQHELEYQMRRRGSIGLFRSFGPRTEIFMGNVSAGSNAVVPAPYDFTMGGAGLPAMPMGPAGLEIRQGTTVMVDMSGNFGTHQTDITRTYFVGKLPDEVVAAHQLSVELHQWLTDQGKAGMPIADLYNHAYETVERAGLLPHFMGRTLQAKYVGHGVGIEINEQPVLTARAKGTLQENMTIAFEPKFVFDKVGAVGIENTYLITNEGVENLTPLPTELMELEETPEGSTMA